MPDPKAIPTWKAGQNGIAPAPPAKALPIDYRSMFTSDMFAVMSDTCCRTIFFPPGHGVRLPMDFELDGPFAKRIRNFVANRNSFLFNGADRCVLCSARPPRSTFKTSGHPALVLVPGNLADVVAWSRAVVRVGEGGGGGAGMAFRRQGGSIRLQASELVGSLQGWVSNSFMGLRGVSQSGGALKLRRKAVERGKGAGGSGWKQRQECACLRLERVSRCSLLSMQKTSPKVAGIGCWRETRRAARTGPGVAALAWRSGYSGCRLLSVGCGFSVATQEGRG